MKTRVVLTILSLGLSALIGLALSRQGKEAQVATKKPLIGLSMDTLKEARWQTDRDVFVKTASQLGAEVLVQSANSDDIRQLQDVQALISRKVDVLVVIPHNGAAMMGMRPIADVQYGDFLFLASDQIINNASKMRYMSGGNCKVPMVMRAPIGATGRGSQHAQSMERYFTGVPGLKVVAVSNAYDAKGILKAAVRDDNPVMIFEHKLLYGSKGARREPGAVDAGSEIPDEDYTLPLDKACLHREGTDVTLLGWLLMHHLNMQAADVLAAEGISAEIIDVRSLSPVDYVTIGESIKKTGRVVIVEEGPKTGGVCAEIAAGIMEHCSEYLQAPVIRIASPDVPVPFTPVLENAYRPDVARILAGSRQILQ